MSDELIKMLADYGVTPDEIELISVDISVFTSKEIDKTSKNAVANRWIMR